MAAKSWAEQLGQILHYKGAGLRTLAYWGSRHTPELWLKHSPGWFGVACGVALRHEREQIRRNLRRLFGKRSFAEEYRDIAKTFITYAHCVAESLGMDPERGKAPTCLVHHEDALRGLLQEPNGFIVVTAHTGGWDIAAQSLMKQAGRRVLLVMDREPDSAARQLQDRLRRERGLEVQHVGADAFEGLSLLRHLRQAGVVAVQIDRKPSSGRCIDVTVAGAPFSLPLGPFVLASLAQVPILPVFVARRGYYQYEVRIGDAIRLSRHPEAAELDSAARDVGRLLETFLLDNPDQWFNFSAETEAHASPDESERGTP